MPDILELVIKSMVIGLLSAAPMGPSGVLVIRKTLDKGRWGGLFTGLGVMLSDAVYIFITIMCLQMVLGYLEDPKIAMTVRLLGCLLLLVFGITTLRNNPLNRSREERTVKRTSVWQNTVSGFLVAIVNPLVVLVYMGMFTFFSFPLDTFSEGRKIEVLLFTVAGDCCWWLLLTYIINRLRNRFDLRGIWMINRILGTVLILAAVVCLVLLLV